MIAEEDYDEATDNASKDNNHVSGLDVKKLLKDIAKEIKKEINPLTSSMEYLSDKMDEIGECMEALKEKLKDVEKRTIHLTNENKHMKTKVMAMEQRILQLEQDKLCNVIEIAGIPNIEKEKTDKVVQAVAKKLEINRNTVKNIRTSGNNIGKAQCLLVEITESSERERWLRRAREVLVTVADVLPGTSAEIAKDKVFIREALTYHLKNLLWKTKQELRDAYKFVWCRSGKILVRKEVNEKVLTVRCEEDIQRLLEGTQEKKKANCNLT